MSRKRLLSAAAPALPLALVLAGCASGSSGPASTEAAAEGPVRIGVVDKGDPHWETFNEAAAAEGIDGRARRLQRLQRSPTRRCPRRARPQPVPAHVYLATTTTPASDDLQPIGSTAIYPLGLYSTQYDSVEDIPEGSTVAVPNDESNQARGLLVLQSAGLIELEERRLDLLRPSPTSTRQTSKVKVDRARAAFTADVASRRCGRHHQQRLRRGRRPHFEDAIAQDDPSDPNAVPYMNIFAATAEDAENPTYLKLVEIFQNRPGGPGRRDRGIRGHRRDRRPPR